MIKLSIKVFTSYYSRVKFGNVIRGLIHRHKINENIKNVILPAIINDIRKPEDDKLINRYFKFGFNNLTTDIDIDIATYNITSDEDENKIRDKIINLYSIYKKYAVKKVFIMMDYKYDFDHELDYIKTIIDLNHDDDTVVLGDEKRIALIVLKS